MESLNSIKNRINGIMTTEQITQSMRVVSSAKIQKARIRMDNNLPFMNEAKQLLKETIGMLPNIRHRYLKENNTGCSAVVVISGDRGLCGGYNININKELSKLIKSTGNAKIITVGQKAKEYYSRRFSRMPEYSVTGISENPLYDDAVKIASVILKWYNDGEIDKVYLIHTEYKSMMSGKPAIVTLLPINPPAERMRKEARCEIDGIAFLERVVPFYVTSYLFDSLIIASVCEQSARIASMDSAVKNAREMIDSLTLFYNQARQSAITQEIVEIVNGADALK